MTTTPAPSTEFQLRPATAADKANVAALIFASTNAWYQANRGVTAFSGPPSDCKIFPTVYERLDPGCCLVAEEVQTGRLAGSCFYHPRPTHVSVGIVNTHPDYFGRGVARQMLQAVLMIADREQKSVRLVSSGMNLDSFSLYNRAGFIPRALFQDVMVPVPVNGLDAAAPGGIAHIRPATANDAPAMARLERALVGVEREKDFRYFIENPEGIWSVSLFEENGIEGFMVSCAHPAMNMIGPGVARTPGSAISLLYTELNKHQGKSPVVLAPADAPGLVQTLYHWGGRNIEVHFGQVRGHWTPPTGLVFPTFLPETG